jgi:hypothetical protein
MRENLANQLLDRTMRSVFIFRVQAGNPWHISHNRLGLRSSLHICGRKNEVF